MRLPTVATDGFGQVVQTVNLKAPPLAGALLPGVRGHFQFAFLDPTGGPGGLNLSDAVAVTFLP